MSAKRARFEKLTDWLQWLETLHPIEIDLGLERIQRVAKRLDLLAPQAAIVTVAGTNGKGSCVETLKQILLHQGLKVGAYTSPHLLRYNERISINGGLASDADICLAFAEVDQARGDISLTYFEFGTLAAMLLFKQHRLDYWILEVGLGGRLDAVNILDPDIAVITSIDLDHESWLGDSREKIALEKAGITRRNGRLVLSEPDEPATLGTLIVEQELVCLRLNKDFALRSCEEGLSFEGPDGSTRKIALRQLPGLPISSMAAALVCAQLMNKLPEVDDLRQVFAKLSLAGRCQKIQYQNKQLILDVAHNPAASRYLAEQLQSQGLRSLLAIVAIMADKNIRDVLSALRPLVDHWFCCSLPGNQRAASAEFVRETLLELQVPADSISLCASPGDALAACSQYNSSDVLVFGSFYTVENVLKTIEVGTGG